MEGHGSAIIKSPPVLGLNDALFAHNLQRDSGDGNLRATGLERRDPGECGNHDGAGFGLPPGVNDGGLATINNVVTPNPGFMANGLTHRPQHADARQIELLGNLPPKIHERADGSRRGVQNSDLVLFDEFPPATGVRAVGGALKEQLRGAVSQRRVDHISAAGDPADVCGAPLDIRFWMQVKDVLVREGALREVATAGVHDALGPARGAAGVHNIKGMLGRKAESFVLSVDAGKFLVPPPVAAGLPGDIVVATLDDENVLDCTRSAGQQRLFDVDATKPRAVLPEWAGTFLWRS
jgi:hypothetical protein